MPKISSRRHFLAMTALLAASAILPTFAHTSPAKSQNQTNLKKMIKNIVLVYGACRRYERRFYCVRSALRYLLEC